MKRTPGVAKNDWASLGLEVLGGGEDFAVLVGGHLLNGQETTRCTSIRLDWIRACFRPEIRNLTCRHCVHRNRNPGSSLVQTAETSGGNVKNFFVFSLSLTVWLYQLIVTLTLIHSATIHFSA